MVEPLDAHTSLDRPLDPYRWSFEVGCHGTVMASAKCRISRILGRAERFAMYVGCVNGTEVIIPA